MNVEIAERADMRGAWTVEATGPDGEIYQAVFVGPDAENRAFEYARFKYDVAIRRHPPLGQSS